MRAEATFRQIQVAFGARGGGGSGGGGSAGRDLASLFDLELDTEKNQYEVGQTANPAEQKAKDIDDALKKLDDLAKRQQDLANQANQSKQDYQQRYQQEMLRREAEQLQEQVQQLARNGQQGQSDPSASGGQPSQGGGQGSSASGTPDSRLQQAADQLRQANDDMRRAASQNPISEDARKAAERLRQATDLLGGMQNQQASQKLDSLAREGDRLASEEKQQADQLKQAFGGQQGQSGQQGQQGQQGGAGAAGKSQSAAANKTQELNHLADDRQQLGQDVARLEKQMQDAVRDLANGNRPAATKLRDALGNTQQSDLDTRIQRSTQFIRRGIDPNSDSGEASIAADLGKLSDQLHQAQQAAGNGPQQSQEQALDRVDRFRDQMEALSRGLGNRVGGVGQPGSGQRGQSGQQNPQGQPGQQGMSAKTGQSSQAGPGAASGTGGPGGSGNPNNGGALGARAPGVFGGFDPGGFETASGPERQPVPVTQADMDRAYQAATQELNDLRNAVKDQPGPLSDISELERELQRLDPKRFPGNPAMLDELHTQVLSTVNKLELQLRRDSDNQPGQIRSGDSQPVPPGYADAVAEYFRKLSNKNP